MSAELTLDGCRPQPLLSYLKALGILRVVARQHDPGARGRWDHDRFVLETASGDDDLVRFFVDRYEPSAVLSPWNAGAGFRTDVSRRAEDTVRAIESTTTPRLASFRAALTAARSIHEKATSLGIARDGKPDEKRKAEFLELCRSHLPDDAVEWLDVAAVLTDEDPAYPLIIGGTGGNFGRGDLSENYMNRLIDVMALREGRRAPTVSDSEGWLRDALFGSAATMLSKNMVGLLDPGGAGGVNSHDNLLNPWDLVLAVEGVLLFGSGVARRFGHHYGQAASVPFTVRPTRAGYGSASGDEQNRGEFWLPIWERPLGLAELTLLIAEGRAQWGRGQAATGLDFARAVATLGTDRSITEFVRYSLIQRHGQAYLAIPVDRVRVADAPEVNILRGLDDWVAWARRSGTQGLRSAINELERHEYAVATANGSGARRRALLDVVEALGRVDRAVGVSSKARESTRRPVSGLDPADWVRRLDDETPEFEIAVALASGRDRLPAQGELPRGVQYGASLSTLLRPVRLDARSRRMVWSERPPVVAGLGARPLAEVLADAFTARLRLAADRAHRSARDGVRSPNRGVDAGWDYGLEASITAAAAFRNGDLDDDRIASLLGGLIALDWSVVRSTGWNQLRGWWRSRSSMQATSGADGPYDPLWCLLVGFLAHSGMSASSASSASESLAGELTLLRAQPDWGSKLTAGTPHSVESVTRSALTRLRMAGFHPEVSARAVATAPDAEQIGAALLVPLRDGHRRRLLEQICPPMSESDSKRRAS